MVPVVCFPAHSKIFGSTVRKSGTPSSSRVCEQEKMDYVIGLSRNPRLEQVVEPLLQNAVRACEHSGDKQGDFDEFLYQATAGNTLAGSLPKWKSIRWALTVVKRNRHQGRDVNKEYMGIRQRTGSILDTIKSKFTPPSAPAA